MNQINQHKFEQNENQTCLDKNSWKVLRKNETGMPRIDGTSKSKRLENPGHPQTLPGDKEPPSVFCFNHPLLGVLVFNRGRSFYILKFGQMRFAIQVTHSSYHI